MLLTTSVGAGASLMPAAAASPLCQSTSGTVFDVYQLPLAGVSVSVSDPDCGTTNTATDAQGRYSALVYPTRPASASVSKIGFAGATKPISFSAVPTTTNDFSLRYSITASVSPAFVRPGDVVTVTAQTGAPPVPSGGGYACSWGSNSFGQLGTGSSGGSATTPVPVVGESGTGELTGVRAIAAPPTLSGYFTLALMDSGEVVGWGLNAYGQLGNGTTTSSATPRKVSGIAGAGALGDVSAVAAGEYHSLFLLADGTVAAAGANDKGQLGNGSTTGSATPVLVRGLAGAASLSGVIAVAAGRNFSVALRDDGSVVAWGKGDRLGSGGTADSSVPVPVNGVDGVGQLTGVAAIASGGAHTLARLPDGAVVAFGSDARGQLGDGSSVGGGFPVQVAGVSGVGQLTGVTAVAAGDEHSLAVRSDGTMVAWGANGSGQLGNGSSDQVAPISVVRADGGTPAPVENVVGASAGARHSLAHLADTTVVAWGDNQSGQLGRGTSGGPGVAAVSGPGGTGRLVGVGQAAAGGFHSVALRYRGCSSAASVTKAMVQRAGGVMMALTRGATDGNGVTTWTGSFVVPVGAAEGTHLVKVCIVDAAFAGTCDVAAQLGVPATVTPLVLIKTYSVDTTPPRLTITSPAAYGTVTKLPLLQVIWADSGVGVDTSTITMAVDGQPVTPSRSGGSAWISASTLTPGIHIVSTTAADLLGNAASQRTFVFTLATVTAGSANASVQGGQSVYVNPDGLGVAESATIPAPRVDVDPFTIAVSATTKVGYGSVNRRAEFTNLVVQLRNELGQTKNVPAPSQTLTVSDQIAALAPTTEPIGVDIAARSAQLQDVTVPLDPVLDAPFMTSNSTATLLTVPAPFNDPEAVANQLFSTQIPSTATVKGTVAACHEYHPGLSVGYCQLNPYPNVHIFIGPQPVKVGVTNTFDDAPESIPADCLPVEGVGGCVGGVGKAQSGLTLHCANWQAPTGTTYDLCNIDDESGTLPPPPGSAPPAYVSAFVNQFVYTPGSGGFAVFDQNHVDNPVNGDLCANGRHGTTRGLLMDMATTITALDGEIPQHAAGAFPDLPDNQVTVEIGKTVRPSETSNYSDGVTSATSSGSLYSIANGYNLSTETQGTYGVAVGWSEGLDGNRVPSATSVLNDWSFSGSNEGRPDAVRLASGTEYPGTFEGWDAEGHALYGYAYLSTLAFQFTLDSRGCS